jgi:multidrug efflux system membrane fusion protein
VKATLTLSVEHNQIVIPSTAVQLSQDGKYVCVVKTDGTADIRRVELGGSYEGLTAVSQGLQAGDRVVTSGQLRLVQGAKVKIMAPEPGLEPSGKETQAAARKST